MGCNGSREFSSYNHRVDKELDFKGQSGPFGNRNYNYDKYMKENENVTIIGYLQESFKKYSKNVCCGWRQAFLNDKKEIELKPEFQTFTYGEMWSMSTIIVKQIIKLGLAPTKTYPKDDQYDEEEGNFKMLGLFARNCPEWVCMDIACQLDSITSATFYSTLGDESFEYVFNQTHLETLCISPENINVIIKYQEKYRFKSLKHIIVFDLTLLTNAEDNKLLEDKMREYNINVYYFSQLITAKPEELKDINNTISKPETLFTLCYTSGTTNLPKGVKVKQRNVGGQTNILDDVDFLITSSDVHFSYLPLAHIMERTMEMTLFVYGASIYYISGETKKYLALEIGIVRPTFMFVVPRVLAMYKTLIMDGFHKLTGLKKVLADKALATKSENFDKTGEITHWLYDSIVFNKVREKFGGRIRAFCCGSAPLPQELAKTIKILFSAPIMEGYGMTETTSGTIGSSLLDTRNLSSGGIIRSCLFKLVDVPELNYHSLTTDSQGRHSPTGEIYMKGNCITSGYFRDKKNTALTIDKDGWLHSGNIGRIIPEDQGLRIIDRVKEIFKLSQGEYIAPAKLESAYGFCPYLEQICVYGDSTCTFVIAIIFPSRLKVKAFLVSKGLMKEEDKLEDVDNFFDKDVLHDEIRDSFNKIAKEMNFNSLEKIPKMIIHNEMFSLQNGLLTDTMKLKRRSFATMFAKQIEKIYGM